MRYFAKYFVGYFTYICIFLSVISCSKHREVIDLGKAGPIGLAFYEGHIWVSDGDNNRLLKVNMQGQIEDSIIDFERPMHLSADENGMLYIPEYGADRITLVQGKKRTSLSIQDSLDAVLDVVLDTFLDAPSAVSTYEDEIAIADFYKHRIVYFNGRAWSSFGKKGHDKKGLLYYPTDVQITDEYIYVADAYNNRVQVFDKLGQPILVIGKKDGMNASTGIFVSDEQIFVTDFENDRVLVYDKTGRLKKEINEGVNKPTDILVVDKDLYIANYKSKNLLKMGL